MWGFGRMRSDAEWQTGKCRLGRTSSSSTPNSYLVPKVHMILLGVSAVLPSQYSLALFDSRTHLLRNLQGMIPGNVLSTALLVDD